MSEAFAFGPCPAVILLWRPLALHNCCSVKEGKPVPLFDRPPIHEDPLKNHSPAFKLGVRVFLVLLVVALIVFLVLCVPLAWDQTYGSPG